MPRPILAATAVIAVLCLFAPLDAGAGPAGERVFAEGVLSEVPLGSELVYSHIREGTGEEQQLERVPDGQVSLRLRAGTDGLREAVITMTSDGKTRESHPYPASVGNPLLLTFLESSLRSMARMTGGSPFYIRNRMKDALRDGGTIATVTASFGGVEVPAEEITFRPFTDDKNRDRMGAFATLELRFLVSDRAPGGFILLSAATRPESGGTIAFREEITLRDVKEVN